MNFALNLAEVHSFLVQVSMRKSNAVLLTLREPSKRWQCLLKMLQHITWGNFWRSKNATRRYVALRSGAETLKAISWSPILGVSTQTATCQIPHLKSPLLSFKSMKSLTKKVTTFSSSPFLSVNHISLPTLFPISPVKSYKSWICILSHGVQGSVHPSCNHWNLWRYKSVATCPTSWGRGCSWAPTWPRSCRGTLTDFPQAKKSQNLSHRLVVALSVVDSVLSGSCGSPSFKIPAPIMSFSSPSQFAFS